MTWEQLIGKIREGLTESGARIKVLGYLLAEISEHDELFDAEGVFMALTVLTLAVSDFHSAIEHLAIGMDAVVETLHEAHKSQEVKGE